MYSQKLRQCLVEYIKNDGMLHDTLKKVASGTNEYKVYCNGNGRVQKKSLPKM